jgi:hypothetical protein
MTASESGTVAVRETIDAIRAWLKVKNRDEVCILLSGASTSLNDLPLCSIWICEPASFSSTAILNFSVKTSTSSARLSKLTPN